MSRLLAYFLRGLVVVVPLAITIYICVAIFSTIDHWLGLPIPGAGFVLSLLVVTAIVVARWPRASSRAVC